MKLVLVISERDNVATSLDRLEVGRVIDIAGVAIVVREEIPRGHKMALRSIAAGQPVIKYGSPIGLATMNVDAGAHVHTHNVASSRGRGDLAVRGESPASIETGDAPGSQGATSEHIGPYVSEEQRREAAGSPTRVSQRVGVQEGCSAGRMPADFQHGLLSGRMPGAEQASPRIAEPLNERPPSDEPDSTMAASGGADSRPGERESA